MTIADINFLGASSGADTGGGACMSTNMDLRIDRELWFTGILSMKSRSDCSPISTRHARQEMASLGDEWRSTHSKILPVHAVLRAVWPYICLSVDHQTVLFWMELA